MITTKLLNGHKTVKLLLFWISISALASCQQNHKMNMYDVYITNQYFENIDSCFLGAKKVENLLVNEVWKIETVSSGEYSLTFYTKSNLKIESKLNLVGQTKEINVFINTDGKITIL